MLRRRTPTAALPHLVLDGTAVRLGPPRRSFALITFWMQFHNPGPTALHDLALLCGSFTDGSGTELEYDEAPITVVGRPERVAPGAGFVAVAHYTTAPLRAPRMLRHSIVLRGRTGEGRPFTDAAALEVHVDPRRSPEVRFRPPRTGSDSLRWR
ncbi:hypothetical protein [Rathayibacter tritici]|uniref:Uncharacterized protein n=1 Tax=Rathayibacter tritici TaxID=33888 RepID=A0A160KVI9_9MICO|nr:hypothetical protein [Rathayibacter tritici]AND17962.1 hypothetical protein A6122_2854 [Rathayibacter tritici]PPF26802.1 hypothetical protein C5C06_10770 [Rathayibacter tritici]PPI18145.1 hypothetical protein C5D07_03750 [Rathayibacter tritici]PPI47488.1 hypothetical protein C5D18_03750 [Rathayibacter tritici]